ncbi:TPA: arginase family protein [Klebsiella variicola subsp. variicola]|nr:arginase family protein [Klebsiella variicola subsp. variicola]HCI6294219.1 arginase family protein [Klebsiella variicola subsp. variicola]
MNSHSDLRLIFPLWLGGNLPAYKIGAEMLAWLAPEGKEPTVTVPVADTGTVYAVEDGIRGRSEVMAELDKAAEIIRKHAPDRMTVLGGDCLVDLEPFAWLSQRWGEGFGILWIDTHPDVMTPAQYENAHAHVLGALMGNGDEALTKRVSHPVDPAKVFIAGIHSPNEYEAEFLSAHNIQTSSPEDVQAKTPAIREWIEKEKITHLAVHFDMDVLDYHKFRAVMFARTDKDAPSWDGVAKGKLDIEDVLWIISEAGAAADIVGLGIAEHLPWDAINLKNMLNALPLLGTTEA